MDLVPLACEDVEESKLLQIEGSTQENGKLSRYDRNIVDFIECEDVDELNFSCKRQNLTGFNLSAHRLHNPRTKSQQGH